MKINADYQEKSKEELIELLVNKDQEIHSLHEMIRLYRLRQFARKSEKLVPGQLSLFDEADLPQDAEIETIAQAEVEISIASYTRKKPGRKPLPAHLPRQQRLYDLADSEKICACGHELKHIKDEKSEQLEIIPAKIYVIEHIRRKYACKHCEETIKTAPMPAQPIPRSIAGPGLLSHVIISKFQDHLPLFRQEHMLRRIGIDLPRSTLCLWIIRSHELLKPMMDLIKRHIRQYDIAYADETTVQVLKETKKSVQSKKYMWLFAGGPPDQFAYYYHYHHSRSHDVLLNFFEGYKGTIHCDGYAGYDALAERSADKNDINLSGCMYHARRKFVEILKISKAKTGVAQSIVSTIKKLSHIEETIKALPPEKKRAIREEQAKPILDEMYQYMTDIYPKTYPKSALGQAIAYTLNQWPKLLTYLEDGRLENNNNLSERAIKPFVIGRKGWLFADSVKGAEAAATLFSLVETCKHHHIEPYDWFRYVLQKVPLCRSSEEITALLPFNIDRTLLGGRLI
jgi:transposase